MATVDTLVTEFRAVGQSNVISAFQGIAGASGSMALAAGGVGLVAGAIVAAGAYAIKSAAQFEQLRVRMDTVFGSAAAGKGAFDWAKEFAKETPFRLAEVVDAMTTMQALGLDSMGMMRTIGDTAAALGLGAEGINRISMQLGQMRNTGKATMEDLRILAVAGVPVFDILQKKMGLTGDQMRRIGDLGLDANKVITALMSGMNERFGGGMEKQSRTFNGMLSTFQDNVQILAAALGESLLPALNDVLGSLNRFFDGTRIANWSFGFKALLIQIREWWNWFGLLFSRIDYFLAKTLGMLARLPGGNAGTAKWMDEQAARDKEGIKGFSEGLGKAKSDMWYAVAEWLQSGAPFGMAGGSGSRKAAPSSVTGAGAGGGVDSIVEQFIRGGGDRLRKGVGGLNLARGLSGGTPTIHVKVDGSDGTEVGRFFKAMLEKYGAEFLMKAFADPKVRAQLAAMKA